MKKIFFKVKVICLGVIAFALGACSKDYLDAVPTNQVSTADAFSTTENAWSALNGIHRLMYSQIFGRQSQGGQSGNMLYMDIVGEDEVANSISNSWLTREYQWTGHTDATRYSNTYNYGFYYMIISNANMIIANVDAATGPEADKRIIKGQALAYRAWSYFQMVQLFGKRYEAGGDNSNLGVPLVLEPSTEPHPRNTVAEVYSQINTDLDAAVAALDGYNRANKSHLDARIAKGIKARVALVQENWASAAQYAREARTGFSLMSQDDVLGGFNNYDNSEWMWASRIQSDQTNYFYSFFAYMSCNYNSTAIRVNPKSIFTSLYDQISDSDVRKGLWDPTGENVEEFPIPDNGLRAKYGSRKFRVADEALSIGDVPYMRASEMYLIEAEALARSGDNVGAASILNEFAVARDLEYEGTSNTGQALTEEIWIQRRVEFWGEGFRFYDLKRNNLPLDRTGGNHNPSYAQVLSVPAGDSRWQFQIPQDEINNTNGIVTQNPQ
ncbi:RagB/SusD family nutrient uptake outer membrane protein [Olivibacter sitiensis]|uniref:RagB/SusD family nutrient uptake outer membrane protein n=1 Tax=Olivibacter sitiensis TaxID=376470 RepID=UPI0003F7D9F5|nr:RagB/SusD family nutrient uptake outer membrane protein [Olivibacter sitiensis]